MGTTRFSKGEIEALRNLQVVRSEQEPEGDTSWIDELPMLPEETSEDSVIAVMMPKKEDSAE